MRARLHSLWRNLVHRAAVERELDDEVRGMHALLLEEKIRAGMDPAAAQRAATIELGHVHVVEQRVRDGRAGAFLETMAQDVRLGARMLRRNPLFALTAVLSFALGIGVNVTIFSLVNSLLLRELPVAEPHRLVEIGATIPGGRGTSFSYPMYEAIRDESTAFAGVAAVAKTPVSATVETAPFDVAGRFVSGNFFEVLGVQPQIGRVLSPNDDRPGATDAGAAAVITHGLWRRLFAGRGDVLGAALRVDSVPLTIVGMLPSGFADPLVGRPADFFVPVGIEPRLRGAHSVLRQASTRRFGIIARLAPSVTLAQATANLDPVFGRFMNRLAATQPEPEARERLRAQKPSLESASTGLSDLRRDFARTVLLLMAAVSLVLLIAATNVVNLLLARAVARRREIAVRLAIGASRGRLVRQLMTESILLGVAGGAVGLAIAAIGAPVVVALVSYGSTTPIVLDVEPDGRVLLFTGMVCVVSALLAGGWPAFRAAGAAAMTLGGGDARVLSHTRSSARWGRVLIAGQVALSLLLLIGAMLPTATLRNIRGFSPGFEPDRVLLFRLDPSRTNFTAHRTATYYREVLDRVRALPALRAASLSAITPLSGAGMDLPISVEGRPREPMLTVYANRVSEGFFATMATPILLGRDFAPDDGAAVVVVNDALARRYFPGEHPIGHRIRFRDKRFEIVGVVANAKYLSLRETDQPTLYLYGMATGEPAGLTLSVRTSGDPAAYSEVVRRELQSIGPVPVSPARPLSIQLERSLVTERLVARLLGAFAAVALLLAAVGLYGVLGHNVAVRVPEIGVRLALGATRASVLRSVLREAWTAIGAGAAVGVPLAIVLSGALETLLYHVSPWDGRVLAAAVGCLLLVATAAAALPAWRASRVDPIAALRQE